MDPALEALEDAFHPVFVTIPQHRLLQRQPCWPCIGDKRLPAQTLAASGEGVFLASDLGDVVADFLMHPLLAVLRAASPAYITDGASRLQTNQYNSTCWPYCHGHALPPSWWKAC